jgi:putative transposase
MLAGALFAAGRCQAQVARELGIARQNVSRWYARWQAGGLEALRSAGPTGYAPCLSDQQLHRIDQALRQGARAHGFDTDDWTLARVATVIERLTGGRLPSRPHREAAAPPGRGLALGSGLMPGVVGPSWCSGMSRAPRCCR